VSFSTIRSLHPIYYRVFSPCENSWKTSECHSYTAKAWKTVSNKHWVHVMIYSWHWHHHCVCDLDNYLLKIVEGNRVLLLRRCSYNAWIISKVFFVISFGLGSGKTSVNVFLDLSSCANSIQLIGIFWDTMSACNISNGIPVFVRKIDFSLPLLFLRLSRNQHVSQSATWLLYSWMSLYHLFVTAVWICFEPIWPKESATIYVFQNRFSCLMHPVTAAIFQTRLFFWIHHDYHCADAPWSVHLLSVLE